MSFDIEQSEVSIQPDFQLEEPIERNHLAVLELDKSSDFEDSFWAPPATWRALACSDCPLHVELSTLRCEKGYWRKRHQKAVERETELKQEIAELKAKLRLREKQLFGRKSEKGYNKRYSAKIDTESNK